MPRPRQCRQIEGAPAAAVFKPVGVPIGELETVLMTLDELEAIRLADLEGLYHAPAALRMGVSRPTFGRLLAEAHHKVAEALLLGRVLRMEGGPVAQADPGRPRCRACGLLSPAGGGAERRCSRCRDRGAGHTERDTADAVPRTADELDPQSPEPPPAPEGRRARRRCHRCGR